MECILAYFHGNFINILCTENIEYRDSNSLSNEGDEKSHFLVIFIYNTSKPRLFQPVRVKTVAAIPIIHIAGSDCEKISIAKLNINHCDMNIFDYTTLY